MGVKKNVYNKLVLFCFRHHLVQTKDGKMHIQLPHDLIQTEISASLIHFNSYFVCQAAYMDCGSRMNVYSDMCIVPGVCVCVCVCVCACCM